MRAGGKVAQRRVEADLEEQRRRLGIEHFRTWNGLERGDPVRLRRAGTGRRVLSFSSYFVSHKRGTSWIDVWDEKDRVIRPVRPEQVIRVRK